MISFNLLVYVDFDIVTIIKSSINSETATVNFSLGKRYSKDDFKKEMETILDINISEESQVFVSTNLLLNSPLYEELDSIVTNKWYEDRQFWQYRYLDRHNTLSKIENIEINNKFSDYISSDLINWEDHQIKSRIISYMTIYRRQGSIDSGLIPYLFWVKYCSDNFFNMWNI